MSYEDKLRKLNFAVDPLQSAVDAIDYGRRVKPVVRWIMKQEDKNG